MPDPYFISFELIIYLQFALCLRHALRHGFPGLFKLGSGVLFGVLLELATIRQLNAYEYGRFLIMVLDVPLCIGMAWSCVIYSTMEFSDSSRLPYWLRPVLDGMLALNIDLALDAAAIRLGFWDWGAGLQFQYFGVPYANFWAWFWVVFCFSLGYRIFARAGDWRGIWLPAPTALLLGLTGVLTTNALITSIVPESIRAETIGLTLSIALITIFLNRSLLNQQKADPVAFWIPFLTHSYILIAGLVSGVVLDPPFLLIVGLGMSMIAFFLHKDTVKKLFINPE